MQQREAPGIALTFLDLDVTPNYATSSWQVLADPFAHPKRQHILPTPPGVKMVRVCLLPRSSPHYAGSHDPIAILAALSSGEFLTLSFPSGQPLPANELPISLSFVQPWVDRIDFAMVERSTWLHMKEKRRRGPSFLHSEAEVIHSHKRYERRIIVRTSHIDGTIRIWDAGLGDEIETKI